MTVIVPLPSASAGRNRLRYELDLEVRPRPGINRPLAWQNAMGGMAVIERTLGKLHLDGRQVRIHEVEPSATRWTKLRDVREALLERITPNEAICLFLMNHRRLIPQDFWGRNLIFFGSGWQLDGDASVICLFCSSRGTSTFYCRLDDPWTKDYAALYIENADEVVAT